MSSKFEFSFDSCPSCGGEMELQETNPSYTPLKRIRLVLLDDQRAHWLTHYEDDAHQGQREELEGEMTYSCASACGEEVMLAAAKVAAYNQMLDKTIGGGG